MAVYANGPNLGHGAEGVSVLLLTGWKQSGVAYEVLVRGRKHCQCNSVSLFWDGKYVFSHGCSSRVCVVAL